MYLNCNPNHYCIKYVDIFESVDLWGLREGHAGHTLCEKANPEHKKPEIRIQFYCQTIQLQIITQNALFRCLNIPSSTEPNRPFHIFSRATSQQLSKWNCEIWTILSSASLLVAFCIFFLRNGLRFSGSLGLFQATRGRSK